MNEGKILVICWTIHPWPTGSSIIVNNLLEVMEKNRVVVVGEKHPTLHSTWSESLPNIYYVKPNINIFGRGQTHLRWLKYILIERQVKKIAKNEGVTKILGIFPDDYYLFLAYRLSKSLSIPLYTWFHNTYLDNYIGYRKLFAAYLQPKVFNHAERVFVMSDGMKNFFNLKYKGIQFSTLVHGFKLPSFKTQENRFENEREEVRTIKFLFTGSLNESCRDAAVRMMKLIHSNKNYELHIYTGNPIADFEKFGISGENVFYHGFIKLDELYKKMEEYDIMLLPHGLNGDRTDVEFKTIFPTRTIPLLVSGRPILAHTPTGTFLTEFLEENKCAWVVTEPDEIKLSETINHLLQNKEECKIKIQNAFNASKIFNIVSVLDKLEAEMDIK